MPSINGFTSHAPCSPWEHRVFSCLAVIDIHAERLPKDSVNNARAMEARRHQSAGLAAVENKNWNNAVDELDSACNLLVGCYGLRPIPTDLTAWQASVEGAVWCDEHNDERPCSACADLDNDNPEPKD